MRVTCQVAFKCERIKLWYDKRLSCEGQEETDNFWSLVFKINVNCNIRCPKQEVQPQPQTVNWLNIRGNYDDAHS